MSCVQKVAKLYKDLKDGEIQRLADTLDELSDQYGALTVKYKEAEKAVVDHFTQQAFAKQAAKLNDIPKKVNIIKHVLQPNFKRDFTEGLLSLVEGTTRNVNNKHLNLENIKLTTREKFTNFFLNSLREDNLFKYVKDKKNFPKILDLVEQYKPEFAKSSDPLKRVAHHIRVLNANLLKSMQDAGSTIVGHENYVFAHSHNRDFIRGNIPAWVEFTAPKLDPNKSFGPGNWTPEKIEKALYEMAEGIEDLGDGGKGLNSLMGGKRQLIFKPGEFKNYNAEYGYRDLLEGVAASINSAAEKTAIHTIFGSNPSETIKEIKKSLKTIFPSEASLEANALQAFDDSMALFIGRGKMPGRGTWAGLYPAIRTAKALEMTMIMGKSGITALNDFATIVVRQKVSSGRSYPIAVANAAISFLKTLPPGQGKKLGQAMLVGLEDQSREIFEVIGGSRHSVIGRGIHGFMTLTGLNAVTASMRRTSASVFGHDLTRTIHATKLNRFQTQTLGAIGLSDVDIANLRLMSPNKEMITPDLVFKSRNMKGLKIEGFVDTPAGREKYFNKLEMKLASYFTSVVNSASPKMGAKEARQLLHRNLPTNHPTRLLWEVVGFLQSTAMKISNSQAEMMRAASPTGDLMAFSSLRMLAGSLFVMGTTKYLMDVVKEYLKTGEVDFSDGESQAKKYAHALLTSGAGGIYVDYMAQVTNFLGKGNNFGTRMPNPLADHVTAVANFVEKPSEKKFKRLLKRSIPGNNLWFIDNEIRRNLMEFGDIHDSLDFMDK